MHPVIPPYSHTHTQANTLSLTTYIHHMPTHPSQPLIETLPHPSTEYTNTPNLHPAPNPPPVHPPQMHPIAEINDSPIRSPSLSHSTAMYQPTELSGMSHPLHPNTPNHTLDPTRSPTHNTPLPVTDTPSQNAQLSSLIQIVPTFEYLIPHWTPLLMNSCKSIEDTPATGPTTPPNTSTTILSPTHSSP